MFNYKDVVKKTLILFMATEGAGIALMWEQQS